MSTESTFRVGKVRQIRIELPVEISEAATEKIAELLWPEVATLIRAKYDPNLRFECRRWKSGVPVLHVLEVTRVETGGE